MSCPNKLLPYFKCDLVHSCIVAESLTNGKNICLQTLILNDSPLENLNFCYDLPDSLFWYSMVHFTNILRRAFAPKKYKLKHVSTKQLCTKLVLKSHS